MIKSSYVISKHRINGERIFKIDFKLYPKDSEDPIEVSLAMDASDFARLNDNMDKVLHVAFAESSGEFSCASLDSEEGSATRDYVDQ